jgi:hypothetical protein
MRHAFLLGTNIFLSENATVSYARNHTAIEFLKILSFDEATGSNPEGLRIDAVFNTVDDVQVIIRDNHLVAGTGVFLTKDTKRLKVYRIGDEYPVLDILQLEKQAYHGLGSNVKAEIEVQQPDHVLSIKANLKVNGAFIWADNEKLHIDGEIYATGVINDHNGVILNSDGLSYL